MKATEYILSALVQEKIDHVFMVPGGLLDNFYPPLTSNSKITPIVAAQEGGAAYMADGYARASGRFGVCFAIGGPGVTNTVTALATAFTDHSPVLLISGEVPTDWEGRGGFQDASSAGLNDIEILRPVTAYSYEIENSHLLHYHFSTALREMLNFRKLPVHLSLPSDLQEQEVLATYHPLPASAYAASVLDEEALAACYKRLLEGAENGQEAKKIVVLAGEGVERSGGTEALVQFAEEFEIPVATTLRAKGVMPEDHRLSLGVFGYAGSRHATEAILSDDTEVLLVLGSGLSQRDTMYWERKFRPSRLLIQVDLNPTSLGKNFPVDVGILGNCRKFLQHARCDSKNLIPILLRGKDARQTWLQKIRDTGPRLYEADNMASEASPIHPARVVAELRKTMPRESVLLVDSGAHRAFCGQYWESFQPGHYLSATNLGPMGWAIPAAIGAKLARPELPLAVVTGDGCMLMHGIEIQTAARHRVPIVYVVINNQALGNVYLRAKKMGPGPAALTELPLRDWAAFARSLGAQGCVVEDPNQLASAFAQALAEPGPFLVDVRCGRDYTTPVNPWSQAKQDWVDDE